MEAKQLGAQAPATNEQSVALPVQNVSPRKMPVIIKAESHSHPRFREINVLNIDISGDYRVDM